MCLSYPQLHTSIAGVYRSSPKSSSGGRYHKVMTLFVYGRLKNKHKKPSLKLAFVVRHSIKKYNIFWIIKAILQSHLKLRYLIHNHKMHGQ